ncbi:hypothetical protein [Streptomyces silvisoli]|uniref:hypothetical protein n=1 Tax=Streptomyces silvisoli TaxID=3034235 RepID=UPI0028BD4A4B|nr:hypothetical protein [Streptomyces silvisoli]
MNGSTVTLTTNDSRVRQSWCTAGRRNGALTLVETWRRGLATARGHREIVDEGLDTLRTLLARPGRGPQETCEKVLSALSLSQQSDDTALLVARTRRLPPDRVAKPLGNPLHRAGQGPMGRAAVGVKAAPTATTRARRPGLRLPAGGAPRRSR